MSPLHHYAPEMPHTVFKIRVLPGIKSPLEVTVSVPLESERRLDSDVVRSLIICYLIYR